MSTETIDDKLQDIALAGEERREQASAELLTESERLAAVEVRQGTADLEAESARKQKSYLMLDALTGDAEAMAEVERLEISGYKAVTMRPSYVKPCLNRSAEYGSQREGGR